MRGRICNLSRGECDKNHSAFEVIPEISQITPTVEIALHQKYILDKFF